MSAYTSPWSLPQGELLTMATTNWPTPLWQYQIFFVKVGPGRAVVGPRVRVCRTVTLAFRGLEHIDCTLRKMITLHSMSGVLYSITQCNWRITEVAIATKTGQNENPDSPGTGSVIYHCQLLWSWTYTWSLHTCCIWLQNEITILPTGLLWGHHRTLSVCWSHSCYQALASGHIVSIWSFELWPCKKIVHTRNDTQALDIKYFTLTNYIQEATVTHPKDRS